MRRSLASMKRITGSRHSSNLFVYLAISLKELDQAARFKADYRTLKFTNIMFCTIMLALTVFEILTFEIFYLEKLGQDQRVRHWQWCYYMTNVEMY